MPDAAAAERRKMQVVSAGLLAGVVLFLGIAVFVRQLVKPVGIPLLSYFAIAFAVLSPFLAAAVDRATPKSASASSDAPSPVYARHLVAFVVLEAAAFMCGVALILAPDFLPLAAAVVPVGAMVLRFPRSS